MPRISVVFAAALSICAASRVAQAGPSALDKAEAYRSIALFEEAAETLEQFATLEPRADKAPAALSDAMLLRLGLGQVSQAAEDVATFTRSWGSTRRAEAAQLALTLATYHAEHADKEKARAVLVGAMPMLAHGPPDLIVRAHALAARVAPSPATATKEWAKVRAAWSDPAAAESALRGGWPGEDAAQLDRRVARALKAVGEALFVAAEELRLAEVEPLKLAPYAGPADRAALDIYGNTTLREFLVKKRTAIERAEVAYLQVLELRPVPAPLSVIAASAAVGAMWGDFVDDLRRMPIPRAWGADPALRRAYLEALSSATEPFKQSRAKPAMKACVSYAARYQMLDPGADRCSAWLASHFPAEHHRVDELVPAFRTSGVLHGSVPAAPLGPPLSSPDL